MPAWTQGPSYAARKREVHELESAAKCCSWNVEGGMDWRACKGRGNGESYFLGDWAFTGEEQHGHHQGPGHEKQSGEFS